MPARRFAAVKAIAEGSPRGWGKGLVFGDFLWEGVKNMELNPRPCMAKSQGVPKTFKWQSDTSGKCKTIQLCAVKSMSNT